MNNDFANLSLEDDEEEGIDLEEGTGEEAKQRVELCLVGKVLIDKTIHVLSFKDRMASIWRPGKGVTVSDLGTGKVVFQFFHEIDITRVLEGGPWSFDNNLVVLQKLKEGEDPNSVVLSKAAFWVQVHDIPAGYLSENLGRQIEDFIGEFLEYDPNNNMGGWRQYMKIRVLVDINMPLKRRKKLRRRGGDSVSVSFKYERLPIFCFVCDRLGHGERYCQAVLDHPELMENKGWGPELRAAARRTAPLAGERWLIKPGEAPIMGGQ